MKKLLLETHSEELLVFLLSGTTRTEIARYSADEESSLVKNIYKGRICHIEPSLQACFVDIAEESVAFLPIEEIAPHYFRKGMVGKEGRIDHALRKGQQLLVQVRKDRNGEEGIALSTFIELPGQYLVFYPFHGKHAPSLQEKRGAPQPEGKAKFPIPEGMTIRQPGTLPPSAREVEMDACYLRQLWQAIESAGDAALAPFLIYQESALAIRIARDHVRPDIAEILVDRMDFYEQLQQYLLHVMPEAAKRVRHANQLQPSFPDIAVETPAAEGAGLLARLKKMLMG